MAEERSGQDWSDQEIDLILADYFDMLARDLRGEPYVKAQRNAELQRLTGRSRGSIEFKHQNISAVLLKLNEPWINGYKPMANYQNALIAGVERYLDRRAGPIVREEAFPAELSEEASIFVGPAPPVDLRERESTPALDRLVRKFDPAARDARNRALGKRGEERVLRSEHARLRAAGRDDLARKIRWVAEEDGDGAGYDILSHLSTKRSLRGSYSGHRRPKSEARRIWRPGALRRSSTIWATTRTGFQIRCFREEFGPRTSPASSRRFQRQAISSR